MASPKKFIVSAAVAAGLLGGGVVGLVLGVPGVSGAQTTTVPGAPTTTAPDSGAEVKPDRPARADGEHCPEKDGVARKAPDGSSAGGTSTNLNLRRGPGGAGRV